VRVPLRHLARDAGRRPSSMPNQPFSSASR
jgi:hypothetical protein